MPDLTTKQRVRRVELSGVVIRCCCGAPERHVGQACPAGFREPERSLAFWDRRWLHRLAWHGRRLWALLKQE